jgi:hypothetical protein
MYDYRNSGKAEALTRKSMSAPCSFNNAIIYPLKLEVNINFYEKSHIFIHYTKELAVFIYSFNVQRLPDVPQKKKPLKSSQRALKTCYA